MRSAARILAAVACVAGLGACHPRSANAFPVTVRTAPQPPRVGDTPLDLTVQGVPADAHITVEGNMTHAGMAPVRADATRVDAQHYRVAAFPFTMAGDWVLTVTASSGAGTVSSDVPLTVEER